MMHLENNELNVIRKHPLFVGLEESEFSELLGACALKHYEKAEKVLYSKTPREGLLLILKGVAEVFVSRSNQREVLEVLQKDDMIGFSSLADFLGEKADNPERYTVEVRAVEDSTCLHIPYPVIEARWHDPVVRDFVLRQATVRLRDIYASFAEQVKLANQWGESEPFIRRIQDVMMEPIVVVDIEDDVQDVAEIMVQKSTSSVVVLNDSDQLIGIITEKDLVQRVIAKGLGIGTIAKDVMTPHPYIISRDAYYYEAMSSFLMNGIKHLPVMDGGRVIGMVTLSDLLRKKNRGMMGILQSVEESTAETFHELKPAMYDVLGHLISDGIPTVHTLDVMTKLYDRVVRHAVVLALQSLREKGEGEPPVAFAWYMMGSGGRGEQFMLTDQDHFLVYADPDSAKKQEVTSYFEKLGKEIVTHLELAGYKRCQGLMMASEAVWRGTLTGWQDRLRGWGLRATNDNLLLAHNFLSFRCLYGDEVLHDQFVKMVKEQMTTSRIFLYRMAEIEKETPVPMLDHPIRALFRMKREAIDIKKHALFPLHHCLQLLAAQHEMIGGKPLELIEKLKEKNVLSAQTAEDLRFAYEVVLRIRVEKAWNAYQLNEATTSEIQFSHLRTKDKEELMMALKTIRSLQNQTLAF
ncbi:CBS domain-containing protein [Halalkalibacter nanhaiisediminis]|uniref:CBS domain-containing protein n=2 Tax=Halalkalibacter nanhaiisediminis TaxID=688079 RepID=A0A562QSY7_9BACI|nr:CBS domain-containing protein [Halalkalibacter nanhaiisediminis]